MPAQHPADQYDKPSIYEPYRSDGPGFVFTDLAHLDRVIAKWQAFHDGIKADGTKLRDAALLIEPPAEDGPSVNQADTTRESLISGLGQNREMYVYAKGYLDRLMATRAQYVADDQAGVDRMRNANPDQ